MINCTPRSALRPLPICLLGNLKEVAFARADSQQFVCFVRPDRVARFWACLFEEMAEPAKRWA
jgi:hypothetical protein